LRKISQDVTILKNDAISSRIGKNEREGQKAKKGEKSTITSLLPDHSPGFEGGKMATIPAASDRHSSRLTKSDALSAEAKSKRVQVLNEITHILCTSCAKQGQKWGPSKKQKMAAWVNPEVQKVVSSDRMTRSPWLRAMAAEKNGLQGTEEKGSEKIGKRKARKRLIMRVRATQRFIHSGEGEEGR